MLKSSMVLSVIVLVSTSVLLVAGQLVVTIDVNLNDSNANVDGLFVSNSMPHMLSKWDQLRLADPTFRELFKAIAPSSLRVLANPLFHGKEGSRKKKKRSYQNSYDRDSKNSESKDKLTNLKPSEGKKYNQDNIIVGHFKDLKNDHFDLVRSRHGQSGHDTSGHRQYADKKGNADGHKHEKVQRTVHRRSTFKKFANKKEADMTVAKWEKLYSFTQYVGWDIFMDFTNLDRNADNSWDTTEVKAFLKYAAKNNIKIPDFSIGNEPNLYIEKYNISYINANETIQDYKDLRNILKDFSLYKDSVISGPETTRPSSSYSVFIDFAKYGGCELVNEYSFHHYYRNLYRDKPTYQDFINTTIMDNLVFQINLGREYMKNQNCFKPIRITETSSISGGLENVADRFIAGFLWLDKLGVAARSGITRVYRFNIWGVSYSVLNRYTFEPNPDYYLTLLYKRLVEGKVFNATTDNKEVRAYANVAKPLLYPKDSLVIYLVNVLGMTITLHLKQFLTSSVETFFFTPGDSTGLLSKTVKVNSILMSHTKGGNVTFLPRPTRGDSILMPAQSYGFIVVPDAFRMKMEERKQTNSTGIATNWSGLFNLTLLLLLWSML